MKLFNIPCLLAALGALALTVSGADVNGKWVSQQMREGRAATISYEFKAEGDKLTGSVINQRGQASEISEGKINGDHISFCQIRKTDTQSIRFDYAGTVSGNELKLQMSRDGKKLSEFTATRAK